VPPADAAAGRAVDAGAFDLPGAGSAAVLCLHGLTGTPYEVRPLAEALAAAGVRAVGPLLPGHQSPGALAKVRHEDWTAEAVRLHRALRAQHERVYVLGVSMGGLLALSLAAAGGVDAAVVIGVPLRLRQPLGALVPLLRLLVPFPAKSGGSDIRDPEARARHPSMPVMPLAAVRQLQHLQRRVRADLGRVASPVLVAHGALDRTAHPADSHEIFRSIASVRREHLVLPRSGHVVPVDLDGPILAAAAVRFLLGSDREEGSNRV
jgi:carboxylesterase